MAHQPQTLRRFAPQIAITTLAAIASISAVLYSGRTATALPQSADATLISPYEAAGGFADLVEVVRPAVVNISTSTVQRLSAQPGDQRPGASFPRRHGQEFGFNGSPQMRRFMERFLGDPSHPGPRGPMEGRSLGSGFIIDATGLVVTNNHVIKGADEIEVILDDGRSFPATVRGADKRTDLALLQIESKDTFPHVNFGNSDSARVGDWVIAIGNPFGLGGTTTFGIVSARGRDINNGPYVDYIQIDASINRGNSGGPLFNSSGEVIGVNTAIFSPNGGSVGIGFAIPATAAQHVVEQLRDSGRVARAWLGVEIQAVSRDIADSLGLDRARGALVSRISPDSPAARSTLAPGDIILGFNGKAVKRLRQLPRLVAKAPVGESATLRVWRNEAEITLEIPLEALPGSGQATNTQMSNPAEKLGLSLSMLGTDSRARLGQDHAGVLIQGVAPQSPAARKGLRPGDIILKVGHQSVMTPQDVVNEVDAAHANKGANAVLLLVERNGDQRYVAVRTG